MSSAFDPSNLSALFFKDETSGPTTANNDFSSIVYAGPIQVRGSNQYGGGRGIFATRAIAAGELLFIAQPNAFAPVQDVFELFRESGTTTVSEASEQRLVGVILEKQQQKDLAVCASLQYLHQQDVSLPVDEALMSLLLGEQHLSPLLRLTTTTQKDTKELTHAEVTQIIRRNAFGPDFTTPESIQAQWQEPQRDYHLPYRLLGLYALPALINHSCVPNAVRVFVGNTMIVHACQAIPAGGEILWSYIPLIQRHRRQLLQDTHGFICQCERCQCEEAATLDDTSCPTTVQELEELIVPSLSSNELKRYVRVSYLSVYLNELNSLDGPPDPKRWIPLGMQLHLALAACHNASTEHLSVSATQRSAYHHTCRKTCRSTNSFLSFFAGTQILHFLYELETNVTQRTFWADQLRRAVMTRYGALGNDINTVRRILQHTRTVLRQRNGLQHVQRLNGGIAFI